jgi:hypothetical protein
MDNDAVGPFYLAWWDSFDNEHSSYGSPVFDKLDDAIDAGHILNKIKRNSLGEHYDVISKVENRVIYHNP